MKKSTILFLVVIYIAAFFVVGLIGISIRSHYQMNYVSEITVEKMGNNSTLVLRDDDGFKQEEIVSVDDPDHARYNNFYHYNVDFEPNMVLQFKVVVKPDDSTYSDFDIFAKSKETVGKVEKNDDSTIYVYIYKARDFVFDIVSTDGNKVTSEVKISAW